MYFNNHMRSLHKVKAPKPPRSVLAVEIRNFLKYYYNNICENPTLNEIKEIADDFQVKKEKIYWWFFGYRRKNKTKSLGKALHQKSRSGEKCKITTE